MVHGGIKMLKLDIAVPIQIIHLAMSSTHVVIPKARTAFTGLGIAANRHKVTV
jgi:hypothetical protein